MRIAIKRIGAALVLILLVIIGFLLMVSPQKTTPFRGASNSIAVVEDIEINNVKQRVVIRGRDINNPVLLHLHGGPGSPDLALWRDAGLDIEDIFTVCYWDQRGAGASYNKNIDPASMTLDQLSTDGIALTERLINQFNKEKIYVQGHSFGTAVATHMAHKSPKLFQAYIGIGQMANKLLAEQRSYDFALDSCIINGNTDGEHKLKKIGRPPYSNDDITLNAVFVQRPIMRQYENPYASEPMSIIDIYSTFMTYREYSIVDKLNAIKGDPFSMRTLWPSIRELDFNNEFPNWEIPVYIIQGKYDQHTVTSVAKEYFDYIVAPNKGYFEFDRSAHNPHLDEQEKYREVLNQIINKTE